MIAWEGDPPPPQENDHITEVVLHHHGTTINHSPISNKSSHNLDIGLKKQNKSFHSMIQWILLTSFCFCEEFGAVQFGIHIIPKVHFLKIASRLWCFNYLKLGTRWDPQSEQNYWSFRIDGPGWQFFLDVKQFNLNCSQETYLSFNVRLKKIRCFIFFCPLLFFLTYVIFDKINNFMDLEEPDSKALMGTFKKFNFSSENYHPTCCFFIRSWLVFQHMLLNELPLMLRQQSERIKATSLCFRW